MFICNHMTREPLCVSPAAGMREIIQIVERHRIRYIPVVNEQRHALGIISDRELRAAAVQDGFWEKQANEVMSRSLLTIASDAPFGRALTVLCAHGADVLLVLKDEALVGILTRGDFLRALSQALALDQEGSTVEVSLTDPSDLTTAMAVLREHGTEIKSAVAARVRDDGTEPVLVVRLGSRHQKPLEKALAEAGLILLVPEEETSRADSAEVERMPEPLSLRRREGSDGGL